MTVNALGCAVTQRWFSTLRKISIVGRWAVLLMALAATAALPARADYLFAHSDQNGSSAPVYLFLTLSNNGTVYLTTGLDGSSSLNQGWWTGACCNFDTSLLNGGSNNNYEVGIAPDNSNQEQRNFFSFTDLSLVPVGATITSASLQMLLFTGSNTAATANFLLSGVFLSPDQLNTGTHGLDPADPGYVSPNSYFAQLGAGQTNATLFYGGAAVNATTIEVFN